MHILIFIGILALKILIGLIPHMIYIFKLLDILMNIFLLFGCVLIRKMKIYIVVIS